MKTGIEDNIENLKHSVKENVVSHSCTHIIIIIINTNKPNNETHRIFGTL